MRLKYFGGFAADADGVALAVRGRGQESLLFRLALDAGTTVAYRALAEDVWPDDLPDDPRAALQSLASRLRRIIPSGALEAVPGGYRLGLTRADVDLTLFQDLVTDARRADDPAAAAQDARRALALWVGEPWVPGPGFDWVVRDLLEDRAHAERLVRGAPTPPEPASSEPAASEPSPSGGDASEGFAHGPVPAAVTSLIGRRAELDLIQDQLRDERLVTLIGPGGAGKTTLALEAARHQPGAIVVELAPAAPGEVWAAIAGAVGRSIRIGDPPTISAGSRERVLEALAGRSTLIVLDNCEHVSAEAAAVALDVLHSAPGSRILATSREPLGLAGEAFVDLGPLPPGDARELFSRRVRAARGAPPSPEEAEAVGRIVARLDGLPLALELAAAKARTLTIAEIDAGLDDRFALLSNGPRAAVARHQTLRALIDWSWETLTPSERTALLTMAVFPDGIDTRDAAAVGARFDVDAASFDTLVDKSLLHRGGGRLRMLETVREYGIDRLRADGDEDAFRAEQARAMAELAARRDLLLRGPAVREGLAWFDAGDENLSAALRTCAEQPGLADVGVRLVRACLWTWLMRERFEEIQGGVLRFSDAAAALDSEPAVVVRGVGLVLRTFAAARESDDSGIALLGDVDHDADAITTAAALHPSELTAALVPLIGSMRTAVRDHQPGAPWTRDFVIDVDGLDDAPAWSVAILSMLRSALAQNGGDIETLGAESEKALRMFRELGDVWGVAFSSQMRSEWLVLAGRLDEALEVADASSAGLVGLTSVTDLVQQRSQGVGILLRLGRVDDARVRLTDIDALARSDGSQRAVAQAEMTAAAVEIAVGDGDRALRHLDVLGAEVGPAYPEQMVAWAQSKRAQAHLMMNRPSPAHAALAIALPAAAKSGDQPIIADVALSLAGWLATVGRDADARTALAASARLRGGVDAADPFLRLVLARLGDSTEPGAGPWQGRAPGSDDIAALTALLG